MRLDSSSVEGGRRKLHVVHSTPGFELLEAERSRVLATGRMATSISSGGFTITGPAIRERLRRRARLGTGPLPGHNGDGANGEPAVAPAYKLSGAIALEYGAPAAETKLRLYEVGFAGSKTLLAEGKTAEDGSYELAYAPKGIANVEVYAVKADGSEVALSRTLFDAAPAETANLVAPATLQPAGSEFARLTAAVSPYLDSDPARLKNAVEVEGRRDFTFLATATGWDGRALALASEAFATAERTTIAAEGVYAMARAGLPIDPDRLALVSEKTVGDALRAGVDAGIVDAGVAIKSAAAFKAFAAEHRFTTKLPGALASAKDFVHAASVSPNDQVAFADVVRAGLGKDLWTRAKAAGVSEAGIEQLQMQGKLAYLTFNNVRLASHLAPKIEGDLMKLIGLGYYDAETWQKTLREELSGGDTTQLDAVIPPAFTGRTTDERLDAYTEELARRVRQMDPHAVTVSRIAANKIEAVPERDAVTAFLAKAVADGFRLGTTPLSSFNAKNPAAIEAVPADKRDATLAGLRTLSSLYSVSPSDEVMSALLQAGFKSSLSIARFDERTLAELLKKYLDRRGRVITTQVTREVVFKAQQQSATVFNVFSGLKRLATTPYAAGASELDKSKRDDQLVKTVEKLKGLYPTLETLFGSVDYCECEHCQSVLSPASYFVDVLHFLDPNDEDWAMQTATYKVRTGVDYAKQKPFDALNARRPDLKNIALTCENTNTALPYIDLANEIMEQLVVADTTPPEIEAYDTGEAKTEDLLAEPHNITWSAYVGGNGKPGLRDLVYPVRIQASRIVRSWMARNGRSRERLARTPEMLSLEPGDAAEVIDDQLSIAPSVAAGQLAAMARTTMRVGHQRRVVLIWGLDDPGWTTSPWYSARQKISASTERTSTRSLREDIHRSFRSRSTPSGPLVTSTKSVASSRA